MAYKHGVYGKVIPSQEALPPDGVGTLPVYIGTAPVGQLESFPVAVNQPILVSSFDDFVAKLGYHPDWSKYTLCEVAEAHFKNILGNIGPIVVINVLDPSVDKAASPTSATVALSSKVGYIDDAEGIANTCAITDKVRGTDFKSEVVWKDGKRQIMITDISTGGLGASVSVSYTKMDSTKVDAADIVGGYNATTDERKGCAVIDLVYIVLGKIPTILAAPGWSQNASVYTELVARSQKIAGHWDAICVVDLDSGSGQTTTLATAKTWKSTNGYTSKLAKACWPKVKYGSGSTAKVYWLSTMTVVTMMQVDFINDNVPFESPSNKKIQCTEAVLADGTTAVRLIETQTNELNEKGITTAIYSGGNWRLWGPHMANYDSGDSTIKPEDIFDCGIRMGQYLTNSLQFDNMGMVDGSMDRRRAETILDMEQTKLNALVSSGALLKGDILFRPADNPASGLVLGDFVFNVAHTTTPAGKSLTFNVQYTADGLAVLTGGAEA